MPSPNPIPTANPSTTEDEVVVKLRSILTRADLTYHAAAVAIGVSPTTMRIALLTGRAPRQQAARAKFLRFVEVNQAATKRAEIRFL